ncbi:MAG: glycosyltransferase family 4 protein [Rhodospirillum sp.]|nr:glycosyltransferase family 4 protein [Rhodospirillum sp.]MCF8487643.1 glycosyltransferase family 4 protein [Rhodospirillum sp.]MCF8503089.1 glycosyltransferase family 4 protein [Rhodospirillum sp.]
MRDSAPDTRPHLLFLVTEDWAFWRHRRPMARAARDAGFRVSVACRVRDHGALIEAEGIRVLPLSWDRQGANPLKELALMGKVAALLRREKPDLVHNVAIKPAIHGGFGALLAGTQAVVTTMAGMGFVYISDSPKARILRPIITTLFRFLFNRRGRMLMVQNADDRAFFVDQGIVPADRVTLVRGSGVDVDLFTPTLEPAPTAGAPPLFVYLGRMLADKGLHELAGAARILKRRGIPFRLALVGEPDAGNPATLDEATLRAWEAEGLLDWWGHRDDIPALWRESHVAVLPSYREGLPKALLEAGAAGRPSITTDAPGCRDLVVEGETGILVPPRSVGPLADAMATLATDAEARARMGAAARARVVKNFSAEAIGAQTVALYRTLLDRKTAR